VASLTTNARTPIARAGNFMLGNENTVSKRSPEKGVNTLDYCSSLLRRKAYANLTFA
jgi:hypothetical protein